MATLLVVDDDASFREGLAETLADLGHEVVQAATAGAAFDAIAGRAIDAMFLDIRMPDLDGIGALRRLRGMPRGAELPVVVLTAFASSANTIEAMRLGAIDHLTKPVGRADVEGVLSRLLAARPRAAAGPAAIDEGSIIGSSPAMRAVQKLIGMAAATDATVLITGETGTGKELVARALHDYGARSRGPFVGVNCAAVPAELLESELFGHARGAFTGAVTERPGRFREAHGGTLFLDEIGDMEPAMQSKILRALQERRVTPIGGRPEAIDVRIVAATHQDLPGRIAAGRFREDLFYRLNVVPIHLPPLRERSADIVPLAEHFLRQASPGSPKSLSSDARAVIAAYAWPGNVRELRNAMERAAALVRAGTVGAADLAALGIAAEPLVGVARPTDPDLPAAVERLEEAMIRRALVESGGNRAEAARRLNINRQLLYQKIKKYGIDLDK